MTAPGKPAPDIPLARRQTDTVKNAFIRKPLHDSVEAHLREAIARGDYRDTLPGERVLADTLKVSRPVLRLALEALEADGVIRRETRRGTRILDAARALPQSLPSESTRVALLSSQPFNALSGAAMEAVRLLEQRLSAEGLELVFRPCEPFLMRDANRALSAFVKALPAGLYLLHQAPEHAQRWFAAQATPCVVMGTPTPGALLYGVDSDYAPAVRHAFGELKRLGHDPARIVLTLPEIELAGQRSMTAGFLDAGGRRECIIRHPMDRADLPVWLAKNFVPRLSAPDAPTAVLSGWNRFTVALVSGISARHGLKIPDDLSVVALADDPVFGMLIPAVTCYGRSPEKYVDKVARLILDIRKHRTPPDGQPRLITPDFMPGDSVGPPRDTRA